MTVSVFLSSSIERGAEVWENEKCYENTSGRVSVSQLS